MSSGAQNQALESLKTRLSQTEAQLAREREEHRSERTSFLQKESLLQSQHNQVLVSLAESQEQVRVEHVRTREAKAQLQGSQRELQVLRKEHNEYKLRAGGILQVREELV